MTGGTSVNCFAFHLGLAGRSNIQIEKQTTYEHGSTIKHHTPHTHNNDADSDTDDKPLMSMLVYTGMATLSCNYPAAGSGCGIA
jgi:hypothetical protein